MFGFGPFSEVPFSTLPQSGSIVFCDTASRIENMGTIRADRGVAVELGAAISASRTVFEDALSSEQSNSALSAEFLGAFLFKTNLVPPIEYLGALIGSVPAPFEALGNSTHAEPQGFDFLAGIRSDQAAFSEFSSGFSISQNFIVEINSTIAASAIGTTTFESAIFADFDIFMDFETAIQVSSLSDFNAEILGTKVQNSSAPVETLATIALQQIGGVEFQGGVSHGFSCPLDAMSAILCTAAMAEEYGSLLRADYGSPFACESGVQTDAKVQIDFESGVLVSSLSDFNLDLGNNLVSQGNLVAESLASLRTDYQDFQEILAAILGSGVSSNELQAVMVATVKLPEDSISALREDYPSYLDFSVALVVDISHDVILEILKTVSANSSIPLAFNNIIVERPTLLGSKRIVLLIGDIIRPTLDGKVN